MASISCSGQSDVSATDLHGINCSTPCILKSDIKDCVSIHPLNHMAENRHLGGLLTIPMRY